MKQYFKSFSVYILIFMVLFFVVMLANNGDLNKDVNELINIADLALYKAKEKDGGRVINFDIDITEKIK